MHIILKENVSTLGKAGDVVRVSVGYARNYLIPKGLALEATNKNVEVLEREKKTILAKIEKEKKKSQSLAEKLAGASCTIVRRVGEQDKLFGSVNVKDIEEALMALGLEVNRKNIILDEPIKALGEFPIKIKLPAGVVSEIKVIVAPQHQE
jgi:large subunit ribosomal protein L9